MGREGSCSRFPFSLHVKVYLGLLLGEESVTSRDSMKRWWFTSADCLLSRVMFYQEFVPNGPLTAQLLKHAFSSLKCYSKYCILSGKEESFLQKKKNPQTGTVITYYYWILEIRVWARVAVDEFCGNWGFLQLQNSMQLLEHSLFAVSEIVHEPSSQCVICQSPPSSCKKNTYQNDGK